MQADDEGRWGMSVKDEVFGVNSPYHDDIDVDDILAIEKAVVDAAVLWRTVGLADNAEFAYRIDPLLKAIDDVIAARRNVHES